MNGTGSECDYEIAFTHGLAQNLGSVLQRPNVLSVFMAITLDSIRQNFSVHSFDWCFARGVNVCYEQHIGVIESAGKLVHQIICASIAMRLKEHDDATVRCANSRRAQGRFDFSRVMTVIVHDRDAALLALELTPAIGAAEFAKGLRNFRE